MARTRSCLAAGLCALTLPLGAAFVAPAARRPVLVPRFAATTTAAPAANYTSSIFVDVDAKVAEAGFTLAPERLVELTKEFLMSNSGLGAAPALLSEDFRFEGPVVGPLTKTEFVNAISGVDFKAAFPDYQAEFYGFNVDPFETNRVWYTARGTGTNTGPLLQFPASGKFLENAPQQCSVTFNQDGFVTRYTIGYVIDRNRGNTGGLGGLYGIFYALGSPLPFPEAQPWKKSWQYALFQKAGGFASDFDKFMSSFTGGK